MHVGCDNPAPGGSVGVGAKRPRRGFIWRVTSLWGVVVGALIALAGALGGQIVAGRYAVRNRRSARRAELRDRQISAAAGLVVAARAHRRACYWLASINLAQQPELFRDAHNHEAAAKDVLANAITAARTQVFDRDLLILVNKAYDHTLDHSSRFFTAGQEPTEQEMRDLENSLIEVENRCQELSSGSRCLPAVTPRVASDEATQPGP